MSPEGAASRSIQSETAQGGLGAVSIGKSYRGRRVVKDVSVHVNRGEVVGLLGPNGAGKTTCFYMITGLVRVDQGQILLDGQDVTTLPMYQRARLGVGYLPQEPSIFRGLTVEQNVMSIVELTERNSAKRREIVDGLLAELHVDHLKDPPASALSGGERRRVEIARALATRPSFMLLDEPFAGIDPLAIDDIRKLILFLKERGLGVLITDHNVRETLTIVDRASIMFDGEVLFEGSPQEVRSNQAVRERYLGKDFN
ncbi:MAG: LPS export ABC transporter ATP-binding protein [Hyphomonadaceae bacterium JAD_PAG50586_4]|nr:MAG: LPS export ABC transporter ATP-binding protein [Hyphomonadaceae bacterium JAD_PAG50586_4]